MTREATGGDPFMKIFRDLGYWPYVSLKKLRQSPRVIADRNPKFMADEVVRPASSDKYAIVVSYSGASLTEDFVDLLRNLRNRSINAILVCNGRPREESLVRLRAEAHRILVRRNIGRDMGAYRAATLYLNAAPLAASRILYFNDSVVYLAGPGLDRTIAAMADSAYPVVGTFENHEFHHHIGSYAFSVSGTVFRDPKVLAFWRRYRPYDIRPHAIRQGEIAMSRRLKKLGYPIDVIYSADRLGQRLHQMEGAQILDLVKYMPTAWRSIFLDRVRMGPLGPGERLTEEFSQPLRRSGEPARRVLALSAVGPSRPRVEAAAQPAPVGSLATMTEEMAKIALIDLMLGEITRGSQVHIGFGVYH